MLKLSKLSKQNKYSTIKMTLRDRQVYRKCDLIVNLLLTSLFALLFALLSLRLRALLFGAGFFGPLLFLALIVTPALAAPIVLSKPGQSSFEWLLIDHEGAKELRGGKECVDCHAEGLFVDEVDVKRVDVDVKVQRGHLVVTLTIPEQRHDATLDIAFLFGAKSERSFARVGCWAACHSDMRYMDNDSGLGKYLSASRKKMTRQGGGDSIKPKSDLQMLRFQGRYLEMWQITVFRGKLYTLWQEDLLSESRRLHMGSLQATVSGQPKRSDPGDMVITVKRPLKVADNLIHFKADERYTLGVALLDDALPVDAQVSQQPSTDAANSSNSLESDVEADKVGVEAVEGAEDAENAESQENAESAENDVERVERLALSPHIGPQHWVSFPIEFTVEEN